MDPNTHVEYARLRLETSNILRTLKRDCESHLEDLVAMIEDKEAFVKEKVENALLLVSAIQGQLTSSLSLSKTLVTDFSMRVHSSLKDIDTSIKTSNPNALQFTRAQFGPGILTPYLDEKWDKIPSTYLKWMP